MAWLKAKSKLPSATLMLKLKRTSYVNLCCCKLRSTESSWMKPTSFVIPNLQSQWPSAVFELTGAGPSRAPPFRTKSWTCIPCSVSCVSRPLINCRYVFLNLFYLFSWQIIFIYSLKIWKRWVDSSKAKSDQHAVDRLQLLIKTLLLRRTKDQKLINSDTPLVSMPEK